MAGLDISFTGETLTVGDRRFRLPYPVDEAFERLGVVIVLYAPDSLSQRFGQFANLVAIDPATGEQRWAAELPTTSSGDRYYSVSSRKPLVAYSVKSFVCTLDPATGRIIGREFVK